MSRRSSTWRQAARQAAYDYPGLRARLRDLQSMSVTPSLSGMPIGGGEHRGTEDAALRQLPPEDQRRLDAVEHAVRISSTLTSGQSRIKLIKLVYFTRKCPDIGNAAIHIPCSVQTAKLWNSDFLLLIRSELEKQ